LQKSVCIRYESYPCHQIRKQMEGLKSLFEYHFLKHRNCWWY
ncbi:Uncharacterized protein APZ42_007662, partial [Daphnia magna]